MSEVLEIIENYLKVLRIKYKVIKHTLNDYEYELIIFSTKAYIQVEHDTSTEITIVSFMFKTGNYTQDWDSNCKCCDTIENEIDKLIDYVKRYMQALNKVTTKLEQIKDICEIYKININNLITINK